MNQPSSVPATKLLSNASNELRALHVLLEQYERGMHALLSDSETSSAEQITAIQGFDKLVQTIENIATLIDCISEQLPEDLSIQEQLALKAVKMDLLAKKLGAKENSAPIITEEAAGNCILFDE